MEQFDVCVIGTGAGGGVMIDELTRAGLRVVALERGKQLTPKEFLQHDELSNMLRGQGFAPDLLETLRPDDHTPATAGRYSLLAHCVGGSTVHWGSWSWRLRPDEFKVLSHEGAVKGANLADWPVDYAELEPYYRKAEAAYGVAGRRGANPHGAPRQPDYPNPPHPYRAASFFIEQGARKMGLDPFPIPMAINSQPYGDRAPCMRGGMCSGFGCPIHAKASPLSVSLPRALATGRLDLRADSRACEITLTRQGRARSVLYKDRAGRTHEVFAKHVIVACGSIGSAQLLHLSRSSRFPDGLANSSGQLGRNLMFHLFSLVNFEMDALSRSALGTPGQIAIDNYHASDAGRGFIRGAVIGEASETTPIYSALKAKSYYGADRGVWGAKLKNYLRRYPYIGGMISIGEDLPVAGNRVDLDPDVVDNWGLPVPRITHTNHPNDLRLKQFFEDRMLDIARAAGAKHAWPVDYTQVKSGTGHILGTCRMGDNPETSVLNRWCRAHDVDNLWVVDGSCFPTSGGYNPTLTIVANAYRVADYFMRAVKHGADGEA